MLAIILEAFARLCFTAIGIVNKQSRRHGLSARGVMGQYKWTLPFFAALGLALLIADPQNFHLDGPYFRTLAIWIGLCLFLNYIIFYLSRFQSLVEMGGYKIGFSVLVSLMIDAFWYDKADWSFVYLLGGAMATAGGWLLSSRPMTEKEQSVRIPLPFPYWVLILLSLVVAGLAPVGYAFFKDCLTASAHQPLLHTVFGQSVLFIGFWLTGRKDYDEAREKGTLPSWRVGTVVLCVIIAALAQTWSVAALSVTTLTIMGLLTGALAAANDILTHEVSPTRRNLFSIALVFAGSAVIALSRL